MRRKSSQQAILQRIGWSELCSSSRISGAKLSPDNKVMRPEITRLTQLGSLPQEAGASVERVRDIQTLLQSIAKPISDEEARALVPLFGPDDCFGLAWTMLHLIETAPNWPLIECLEDTDSEWVASLRDRAVRGGLL